MSTLKKFGESWTCDLGCDTSKGLCEHMDQALQNEVKAKKSVYAKLVGHHIDHMANTLDYDVKLLSTEDDLTRFRKSLRPHNLNTMHTEMLVLRHYFNKTLGEIAEELRLPNSMSVSRELRYLYTKLKKEGFKA